MGRKIEITREIIEKAKADLFNENYLDEIGNMILKMLQEETGVEWSYLPTHDANRVFGITTFYEVLDEALWCNPDSKRVHVCSPELFQMLLSSEVIRIWCAEVDQAPFSFEFPGYPRRLEKQ